MNLKALRMIALLNGFGEDGKTDTSIVFSTKEHSTDRGVFSGVDVDKAEGMKTEILHKFPDLVVSVSPLGAWVLVEVSEPKEEENVSSTNRI